MAPEGGPESMDRRPTRDAALERSEASTKPSIDLLNLPPVLEEYSVIANRAVNDAIQTVDREFDSMSRKGRTDRMRLSQSVIRSNLKEPILQFHGQWQVARQKAYLEHPSGDEALQKRLTEINNEYSAKIDSALMVAKSYVAFMSHSENWIDETKLAEMEARTGKLTDILINRKDLTKALLWALNHNVGGHSLNSPALVKEVYTTLTQELRQTSGDKHHIWTIMLLMDSKERTDFAKHYFESEKISDPAAQKAFLEEANNSGVFSPTEMKALLGANYDASKESQYGENWKLANDFLEAGKKIGTESYGATNQAGRYITIGNTLLAVANLAATATILGNTAVALYNKNPKSILTNPYILKSSAILFATSKLKGEQKLAEFLEASDSRETTAKAKAYKELKIMRETSPVWTGEKGFFAKDTGDSNGIRVFADYVQKITAENDGTLPEKRVNAANFGAFLKANPKLAPYQEEFEKMKNTTSEKDLNESVLRLSKAFFDLSIGGAQSKTQYQEALKEVEKI